MIGVFVTGLIWQTVVIAHFYYNRDQIAAIHCVNKKVENSNCKGSCHLKKQLSTTDTEKHSSTPISAETGLILLLGFTMQEQLSVSPAFSKKTFNNKYLITKAQHIPSDVFQPPRFC